ncbi:MAG TPA: transketolase C-terminal domain-containing protein, partial [Mycobacteriales bacterium]|nr:transketolase C-terminal domain-containing protein [Mycobacteriales bacterium]
ANADGEVLLVGVGSLVAAAVDAAELLRSQGVAVTVVDPRWVLPVDPALVEFAAAFRVVVVAEDGVVTGGVGDAIARALRDVGARTQVETLGLAAAFVPHGRRNDLLAAAGLDAAGIAATVRRLRGAEVAPSLRLVGVGGGQPSRRDSIR